MPSVQVFCCTNFLYQIERSSSAQETCMCLPIIAKFDWSTAFFLAGIVYLVQETNHEIFDARNLRNFLVQVLGAKFLSVGHLYN